MIVKILVFLVHLFGHHGVLTNVSHIEIGQIGIWGVTQQPTGNYPYLEYDLTLNIGENYHKYWLHKEIK